MAALLFVLFISLTSWILSLPHNNNKCSDDGCTDNSSPHQANGTTQQSRSKEPSLLQHPNCSLETVICFENKTQAEGRRQSLQSSISWNCTSSSTQVNIYNCKDRAFNTTKMCCEFSIKKRNRTESTGPAYCLERYSDHTGKTSLPSWDCYWQFSVLHILSTSGLDDGKQALYFSDCKTPNSNSYIHNCSEKKPKNKLSSQNTTFTALGESLTGKVKLRNCTSYSIQTSLVEMEDIARQKMGEILRANLTGELSFRNQIIELHLVVTRDFNNTITVPDPSEADKPFRSLVSVLPGSIDAKHGRLGLLAVAFYFKGLCNETEDLNVMASSNGYSSLQSPIVSVLAMSPKGDINTLKDNATITFGSKITDQSTVKCVFLNRPGSSRPSWSGDGMTLDTDQKANYTICLTDHFTSFAVLIDYQNDSPLGQHR